MGPLWIIVEALGVIIGPLGASRWRPLEAQWLILNWPAASDFKNTRFYMGGLRRTITRPRTSGFWSQSCPTRPSDEKGLVLEIQMGGLAQNTFSLAL